jgi:pyruvate formate lyase activating enzyme
MNTINRREFLGTCGRMAAVCAGCSMLPTVLLPRSAYGLTLQKGYIEKKLSPYYTPLEDGAIRCELCPHHCEVDPGDRGLCEVRENIGGKYYSLVYANPCAIHVDPIEKKPFFHVLPGTNSFSIATAGCNFDCKFCQNWSISQARPEDSQNYDLSPGDAVSLALQTDCSSIASTYVEPSIFMEYMLDIGRRTRKKSILKVMHSNGFVAARPLADLCEVLDAACIDLKGFTEAYYREMTGGGSLAPVLETLKTLRQKGVHTEIVTLVVPGGNDDMKTIRAMCDWIYGELGPDVPLHFSKFYPQYKLKGVQPTPVATLEAARQAALEAGLHYVYLGNVYGHVAESTYCPNCGETVIHRAGYESDPVGLEAGQCRKCRTDIPGIWSISDLRAG